MSERFDAIVIGAGQAGPALAARLDREGLQTAFVEPHLERVAQVAVLPGAPLRKLLRDPGLEAGSRLGVGRRHAGGEQDGKRYAGSHAQKYSASISRARQP